jgi:Yip1 domain
MVPVYYVGAVAGGAIVLLICASVLMLGNMMAGAEIPFNRTLAVCSYAFYATGLVRTIGLAGVLAAVKDFEGFDIENPLPLNPGFFVDRSSKFLHSVASSVDLITMWGIFLIALGLHKAFPRASTGKFFAVVVCLWLIWVFGKAAAASLFRFGG